MRREGTGTLAPLLFALTRTRAEEINSTGAGVLVITETGILVGRGDKFWQDFGGKREPGESNEQTALRELQEEANLDAGNVEFTNDAYVTRVGEHVYVTYVAILLPTEDALSKMFDLLYGSGVQKAPEIDEFRVVKPDEIPELRLHRRLVHLLHALGHHHDEDVRLVQTLGDQVA